MAKTTTFRGDVSRRDFLVAGALATGLYSSPASAQPCAAPTSRFARGSTVDLERFVDDCNSANKEADSQTAVLEVLARAVRDSAAVCAAVGEPREAGLRVLHRSTTLTIFCATWTPRMNLMPHNHLMWANIGIYSGREDNILWRRGTGRIDAFGAKALFRGDAVALPADVIHSVTNPLVRFTGGIHIYGGDFFATPRRQWDPETMVEEPSNGDVIRAIFNRENELLRRCGQGSD